MTAERIPAADLVAIQQRADALAEAVWDDGNHLVAAYRTLAEENDRLERLREAMLRDAASIGVHLHRDSEHSRAYFVNERAEKAEATVAELRRQLADVGETP